MEINTEPEKKKKKKPRHGAKISICANVTTRVIRTFENSLKKEILIGRDEKCNIKMKSPGDKHIYPDIIARVYRVRRQIWIQNYTPITLLGTPNKSLSPGQIKIALGNAVRFDIHAHTNIVMLFEPRPELPHQEKAPVLTITNSDNTNNIASDDDDNVIITSVIEPVQLPPSRRTRSKTPITITLLDSDTDDEDAVFIMQTQ